MTIVKTNAPLFRGAFSLLYFKSLCNRLFRLLLWKVYNKDAVLILGRDTICINIRDIKASLVRTKFTLAVDVLSAVFLLLLCVLVLCRDNKIRTVYIKLDVLFSKPGSSASITYLSPSSRISVLQEFTGIVSENCLSRSLIKLKRSNPFLPNGESPYINHTSSYYKLLFAAMLILCLLFLCIHYHTRFPLVSSLSFR